VRKRVSRARGGAEARIAREAAALRTDPVIRIRELTAALSDDDRQEIEQSGGVMTDDGGPPGKEEEDLTRAIGLDIDEWIDVATGAAVAARTEKWWRRRESNPRPRVRPRRTLHA